MPITVRKWLASWYEHLCESYPIGIETNSFCCQSPRNLATKLVNGASHTLMSLDEGVSINDLNLDWPSPIAARTREYARRDCVEVNLGQVHYVSAFGANMGAHPLFFRIYQGSSIQMLQSIGMFLQSDPLIADAFHESHGSCSQQSWLTCLLDSVSAVSDQSSVLARLSWSFAAR